MKTRSAEVDLTWNGAAVKSKNAGPNNGDHIHGSCKRRSGQPGYFDPRQGPPMDGGVAAAGGRHAGGCHQKFPTGTGRATTAPSPAGFSSWTISSLRGGRSPGPYPPCLYRRTVHFGKPSGQRHGRKSRSRRSGKRLQAGPELLWPGMWRGRHSRSNPLSSQARQIVTFTCRCARATATP